MTIEEIEAILYDLLNICRSLDHVCGSSSAYISRKHTEFLAKQEELLSAIKQYKEQK